MKQLKRVSAAALVAVALSVGLSSSASAAMVPRDEPVVTTTGTDLCQGLADAIAFLEERPASRLRDFLLGAARRLFAAHCS
jgi:hypothetical protein